MAVTCKNCGGAHAIWECKRPATKSGVSPIAESGKPKSDTLGKVAPRAKSTAARKPLINVAKLFSYDEENGHLFWRVDYGRAKAGSRAGTLKPSGYRSVQVDGEFYQEHRIIWVFMTAEEIPNDKQVDHINQKKSDNRWSNLRLATPAQQQINSGVQKNNRHGKGVSWRASNEKWRADIYVDGKAVCLGHFSTQMEAQEAYEAGAKKHYGEYAPQALPVDTNLPQGSKGLSDDGREVTLQRPVEGTAGSSNGRTAPFDGVNAGSTPAPASKFDKKAWSRAYMKIWMRNKRAKLKAATGA